MKSDSVKMLFWDRVDRSNPAGCWPWKGGLNLRYGVFCIDGKRKRAHRVAWSLTHGAIPPGLCVCHHCDNPPCCNPAHLFLGDAAANVADMAAKGRSKGGRLIGEKHPKAKLTWAKVREIRAHWNPRTSNKQLAQIYGVTPTTIRDIGCRRTWIGEAP